MEYLKARKPNTTTANKATRNRTVRPILEALSFTTKSLQFRYYSYRLESRSVFHENPCTLFQSLIICKAGRNRACDEKLQDVHSLGIVFLVVQCVRTIATSKDMKREQKALLGATSCFLPANLLERVKESDRQI